MDRILFPPRPKGKMNPKAELVSAERTGRFVAQRKFNGTRTLMYVDSEGGITLFDRYGRENKYQFSHEQKAEAREALILQAGWEYWLDGELMHFKTKGIKNTLVFYDLLWEKEFLFGCNQIERLQRLAAICNHPISLDTDEKALYVSQSLRLAEVFDNDFMALFEQSFNPTWDWCEGLVLRDRNSVLDTPCYKVNEEVRWQKRCRKPNKNYNH